MPCAWLFRPLNFPEPDRPTISVYATRERPSEPAVFVLYRDHLSWKERSRSFESMAAVFPRTYLMGDVADIGTADGLVIAPALRAAQTDPNEAMRTGGDRGSSTAFGRWSQTGMLAAQVAASVVLLVAVVLLVRSFGRLQDEPLGFHVSNITVASLALPTGEFDSGDDRHAFFERLAERLGNLPAVWRTTASTAPLLSSGVPALVQTRASDDETALRVPVQDVTLGYFATLGIPLSAGRPFDGRDGTDAPPVAILNESAARLLFGSPADALGRRRLIADDTWRDVAGVVGDTRSAFFNTLEWVTNPVIYLPARQALDSIRDPTIRSFALYLQIESDAALSIADVQRAVASSPRSTGRK